MLESKGEHDKPGIANQAVKGRKDLFYDHEKYAKGLTRAEASNGKHNWDLNEDNKSYVVIDREGGVPLGSELSSKRFNHSVWYCVRTSSCFIVIFRKSTFYQNVSAPTPT
jgi:hypothetical protein